MKFTVVSIFPQLIEAAFSEGLVGQAVQKGLIQIKTVNPRQFTQDLHKTVDDRPYGGGDGMTMLSQPLAAAVESIHQSVGSPGDRSYVIYLSPQGQRLDHSKVLELSRKQNLTLICGRYGGIDQRFINKFVDEELSVGDYILSGGELAAAIVIDSVSRQVPGVLGHASSAEQDSLSESLKGLLESPQFTRPAESLGQKVPQILRDGHHAKIQNYRNLVSILVTYLKRPDLLGNAALRQGEIDAAIHLYKQMPEEEKEALGIFLDEDALLKLRSFASRVHLNPKV